MYPIKSVNVRESARVAKYIFSGTKNVKDYTKNTSKARRKIKSDSMDKYDVGKIIGKSEVVWAIMEQMKEIDVKWAAEDLWSTICAYLSKHLTAQGQVDLRHIDMEFRTMLSNQMKKRDD